MSTTGIAIVVPIALATLGTVIALVCSLASRLRREQVPSRGNTFDRSHRELPQDVIDALSPRRADDEQAKAMLGFVRGADCAYDAPGGYALGDVDLRLRQPDF